MTGRLIINLILFIIALISVTIISPLGFLYAIINRLVDTNFRGMIQYVSEILFSLAADLDKTGNYINGDLFIDTMSKEGYKFGNIDETISSALGKNKRDNTLTGFGRFIAKALNKIDKNHVEKSINTNL